MWLFFEPRLSSRATISGKTVRVDATTSGAPFEAQVQVLFVSRKGDSKQVFDSSSRSMTIGAAARPFEVTSKKSEHYYGWAVVVKHRGTGEVVAVRASSHAVEQFARTRRGR